MSLRIAFDCDGVLADLDSVLAEKVADLFGDAPTEPEPTAAPGSAEEPAPAPGPAADAKPETGSGVPAAPIAGSKPAPPASDDESVTPDEEQAAPPRIRALTRSQQHDLWKAIHKTENFWETLAETEPGAVARLAQIAKERRWEVIFITQRPSSAGDTTQLQTQRWLTAHGFDHPSVYVLKGTRGKVADALSLDVVVDDRPDNCLDVKLESRARAILVWSGDPTAIPANARKLGIEPVSGINACLDLLTAEPGRKPGLLRRLKRLVGS
jgi:hypothetical protein